MYPEYNLQDVDTLDDCTDLITSASVQDMLDVTESSLGTPSEAQVATASTTIGSIAKQDSFHLDSEPSLRL